MSEQSVLDLDDLDDLATPTLWTLEIYLEERGEVLGLKYCWLISSISLEFNFINNDIGTSQTGYAVTLRSAYFEI